MKRPSKGSIVIPRNLVKPIRRLLTLQLNSLKKRRSDIDADDPFKDSSRASDNASPDAEADEQFGHARVSAVRAQLDRKIIQTWRALSRIKIGKYGICEECGGLIDTDRLVIYPEATYCVSCEAKRKKEDE